MNIATIDRLVGSLQRVGQAGALPKNATQAQLIDELQRELGALADSVRALLAEERASPRFSKDSNLFLIDCHTSGNILSNTQAAAEGFASTDGLAVYRHGLGYKLDRAVQVYFSYLPTINVTIHQQADHGGSCRLWAFDENRTVFQVDADAVASSAIFVMACYASSVIPSTTVNPNQATKTGAATKQLGLIDAETASGLP